MAIKKCLHLTSCTVSKALLDLMTILWLFLAESAETFMLDKTMTTITFRPPHIHICKTSRAKFCQCRHINNLRPPVRSGKEAVQSTATIQKSKLKKHHVAYDALHIKSTLHMHLRGGTVGRAWWLVLVCG